MTLLPLLLVLLDSSVAQAQDSSKTSSQAQPGSEKYQRLKAEGALQKTERQESTPPALPEDRFPGPAKSSGEGLIVPVDSTRQDSLSANDDESTDAISLGFDFVFYGSTRTEVYINNNGNLSFGSAESTFTPEGFPSSSYVMIAPFWADVDTRGSADSTDTGIVYYQVDPEANRLVVTWDSVGYYNSQTDKLNTFQVILSKRADPITTEGKNLCFAYGNMGWTTGDVSGGTDGFGGTPATVGVNKGDGEEYALVGRFDTTGVAYDGPGGDNDGVDYLDGQTFCFDVSNASNVPPLTSNFPDPDTLTARLGETLTDTVKFTGPEETQTVQTSVSHDIPTLTTEVRDGNPAEVAFTFSPASEQAGRVYTATFSGTDDGTPSETTQESLFFRVSEDSSELSTETVLENPDELPTSGEAASVDIRLPPNFSPNGGTFFYREAGTRTFQRRAIDPSAVGTDGTVSLSLPASVVTGTGVQYYLQLQGTSSDREGRVQFSAPPAAPERTGFLPVRMNEVGARGPFEPMAYRMLTVPVGLGDSTAFEVLEEQYGDYDPAEWKLARWDPAASSYQFGAAIDSLRLGEAAWLITAGGDSLTIADARSADASGPRSIELGPGWNQIGTPFAFPVRWSEVARPAPVRTPVAYDTSGYVDVTRLRPWRGAFVYNEADTSVTIEVPPVKGTEGEELNGSSKSFEAAASEAEGYRLQAAVTAERDGRAPRPSATWLGFAEGAEVDFGPKDRAKPPAVGEGVRLHVVPEEGPALARSLKPSSPQGAAWDLQVGLPEPLEGTREVTIVLSEEGARPRGFRRYVIDQDRQRRLPVTNGSVSVPLSEQSPTRYLRVIVGTESFARKKSEGASLTVRETKLRDNAPNPFSEATTLAYQLATDERVRIAVYDALGRRVQTLVDEPQRAGVHEVEWRPGVGNGERLASGIYFCRMEAGEYTATRKLVLIR